MKWVREDRGAPYGLVATLDDETVARVERAYKAACSIDLWEEIPELVFVDGLAGAGTLNADIEVTG